MQVRFVGVGSGHRAHSRCRRSQLAEASAPGKVLIVGGYLVLEQEHAGLVVAASSRFYSGVWWEVPSGGGGDIKFRTGAPCADAAALRVALLERRYSDVTGSVEVDSLPAAAVLPLTVASPQFHARLQFTVGTEPPFTTLPTAGSYPNSFIQRPITTALLAASVALPAGTLSTLLRTAAALGGSLGAALQADNDFYSQLPQVTQTGAPVTVAALAGLPPCLPLLRHEGQLRLSKTGLGSSAALTTSLAGALLAHCGVAALPAPTAAPAGLVAQRAPARDCLPPPTATLPSRAPVAVLPPPHAVRVAHHVAQVAHCLAQGKVGSGFDVATACYGSMAYRRVSKGVLGGVMSGVGALLEEGAAPTAAAVAAAARPLISEAGWDYALTPFSLPPGLDLALADVCGGSETPSMVRKVLRWLGPEGAATPPRATWAALGRVNAAAGELLGAASRFAAQHPGAWGAAVKALVAKPSAAWTAPAQAPPPPQHWCLGVLQDAEGAEDVRLAAACTAAASSAAAATSPAGVPGASALLVHLRDVLGMARALLRVVGERAGVPIEPAVQGALLDATLARPGVLAAGVPGAGGFDAVFAITLDGAGVHGAHVGSVKSDVGALWLRVGQEGRVPELQDAFACPLLLTAGACAKDALSVLSKPAPGAGAAAAAGSGGATRTALAAASLVAAALAALAQWRQ